MKKTLPMLPLRGKYIFPNTVIHFDVSRSRSVKAIEEAKKGKLCVLLLPVSTSTKLFHDHIKPNAKEIRFVERRIKFIGINSKGEYVKID